MTGTRRVNEQALPFQIDFRVTQYVYVTLCLERDPCDGKINPQMFFFFIKANYLVLTRQRNRTQVNPFRGVRNQKRVLKESDPSLFANVRI